jgi:U4/U6 small nuclear ribonucleoprotein PRP31
MTEPTGTGTLADSLLDDLDDLSDAEEDDVAAEKDHEGQEQQTKQPEGNTRNTAASAVAVAAAAGRTKLTEDATLLLHLTNIRHLDRQQHQQQQQQQQQQEYEHELMTLSNKHLVHLANELAKAHLDLCRAYSPKFPELRELISDPVQYKNAVRVISNEMDVTKLTDQLNVILGSNQIITISVAASTSSGQPLTDSQLKQVDQCADYMDEIIHLQQELTAFVESRITALAPSMCALVGPTTAAKLVGLAGGLAQLSNIPACNLQVLGQVKHTASSQGGLSSISMQPHAGILAESTLVQGVPSYLQKKALKVLAAKLALAARCDFINVDTGRTRSASSGLAFRQEIVTKIAEWQTPHKAQVLKALPK